MVLNIITFLHTSEKKFYNTWEKNDRKDAKMIPYLMQQDIMHPFLGFIFIHH